MSAGTISLYGLLGTHGPGGSGTGSVVNYPLSGGSSRQLNGPWQAGSSSTWTGVKDIATITSSVNVVGFLDGQNRAKYFYSTVAGSVVLPTLSAIPNNYPPGAVQLGASNTSLVMGVVDEDTNGNYFIGSMIFQLTPAA